MGCPVGPVRRAEIDRSYAMNEVSKHVLEGLRVIDLMNLSLKKSTWVNCRVWREHIPFYRRRGWLYK